MNESEKRDKWLKIRISEREKSRAEVSGKGRKMCWNDWLSVEQRMPSVLSVVIMGNYYTMKKQGRESILLAL